MKRQMDLVFSFEKMKKQADEAMIYSFTCMVFTTDKIIARNICPD